MKLGISSESITDRYGVKEGLKLIKKSGFDYIDVSFASHTVEEDSIYSKSEDEFLSFFHDFKRECDDAELTISQTHGRLTTCVVDENEQNIINQNSLLDLKASSILKAPVCVFHNAKLKQLEEVSLEEEYILQRNKEFFEDYLTPLCHKYNVKFGLETHGRSITSEGSVLDYVGDANKLLKSFDMMQSDYKTICFDSGHANEAFYYGGPTVTDALKILAEHVSVLHLHDNQSFCDSHLLPLNGIYGSIDWPAFFDILDDVGYDGVYNWELGMRCFGNYLDKALPFIGGYLRHFVENKGRI